MTQVQVEHSGIGGRVREKIFSPEWGACQDLRRVNFSAESYQLVIVHFVWAGEAGTEFRQKEQHLPRLGT